MLSFLMEREYPPYAKWFGSAFRQLSVGPDLEHPLLCAIRATEWRERQTSLVAAFETIADLHNRIGHHRATRHPSPAVSR